MIYGATIVPFLNCSCDLMIGIFIVMLPNTLNESRYKTINLFIGSTFGNTIFTITIVLGLILYKADKKFVMKYIIKDIVALSLCIIIYIFVTKFYEINIGVCLGFIALYFV